MMQDRTKAGRDGHLPGKTWPGPKTAEQNICAVKKKEKRTRSKRTNGICCDKTHVNFGGIKPHFSSCKTTLNKQLNVKI